MYGSFITKLFMLNPVDILGQALVDTGMTLISFLPSVIIAIIVFALGWGFGAVLGRAVDHIVTALRIDRALHQAGFDKLSEKAGIRVSVAAFLGGVVKWSVVIAFTLASAEILGLSQVTQEYLSVIV